MSLLDVKDLKTYFYTDSGVAKAVDGVTFSVDKGRCSELSENPAAERV